MTVGCGLVDEGIDGFVSQASEELGQVAEVGGFVGASNRCSTANALTGLRAIAKTGQDEAAVQRIDVAIAVLVGGVAVGIARADRAAEAG